MRSRIRRRTVAFTVAVGSALAVVGILAATASALVRGHASPLVDFNTGTLPPPAIPAFSAGAMIAGLAISVVLVAVVAWVAVRSDNRSRARLSLVESGPSVAARSAAEDQERRAA